MSFIDKVSIAVASDKPLKLSRREARELADFLCLSEARAYSSDMLLQSLAFRINGQASLAVH
jgi:hypothetical protein